MELKKTQGSVTFQGEANGYDVTASIQYDANGKVTNVHGGMIRTEGRTLANFNLSYHPNGEFSESHNFYSLNDEEKQVVADIINDFVSEAINKVSM